MQDKLEIWGRKYGVKATIGSSKDCLDEIRSILAAERKDVANKILRQLVSDYSLINPPSKKSPMEFTSEAKGYNLFAADIHKWAVLEGEKWRPDHEA